jgi:adenylate kinase family enzyme
MPAKIPAEILEKIRELSPQIKNLDLVELMALEVLDTADFYVSECLYPDEETLKKWIYNNALEAYESARRLFEKFYDYNMPEWIAEKFNRRVEEIVQKAVKRYREKCAHIIQMYRSLRH